VEQYLMNPSDTPANLKDQIADLFFSTSKTLDRYRETHDTEINDAQAAQLVNLARQLRHLGDEYNVEAARDRVAAVQGALADLGTVTAKLKQQLKTVLLVRNIISVAEAAIALGAAISTGSLSGVGSALGRLAKAAGPLVETARAGGGPAPDPDE
jgi:hypothetical protein